MRLALVLVALGLVALVGHQSFAAAWSNRCDPGNAQLSLLKNDPVVSFHPAGEVFAWENDGPDNGWTCANPTLSISHVGQDLDGMLSRTRSDMADAGWTAIDLGSGPPPDFYVYEKTSPGGVRLSAVILRNAFWVEVDLSAPGLHPGARGF